ncbi:MAG: hypothetical protein HC867_02405 [Bacteroidia bacterium]|nr:hypothetical protein [Bacteroidia bacterium]
MTDNEILHADMLDILFEHRNKSYGAYVLRRQYSRRLRAALVIALSALLLFILLQTAFSGKRNSGRDPGDDPYVKLSIIEMPEPKSEEPDQPKRMEQEEFKQVRSTNRIQFVDDSQKTDVQDQKEIEKAIIGTVNINGKIPVDPNMVLQPSVKDGEGTKEIPKYDPPLSKGESVMPSFPGGADALAHFLRNNLSTPFDLDPGEKVTVLIKFLVSTDGSISGYEIVQRWWKTV